MNREERENNNSSKVIRYFILSIFVFAIYFTVYGNPFNSKDIVLDNKIINNNNNNNYNNNKNNNNNNNNNKYNNNDNSDNNNANKSNYITPRLFSEIGFNDLNGKSKLNGTRKVLLSSQGLLNSYFVGEDSFVCSSLNEYVTFGPSNFWSIILADLSFLIDLSNIGINKLNTTIEIPNSLINDNNLSTIQKESVLIETLSNYVDPSLLPTMLPIFSTSESKDILVYLTQILGKFSFYHSFRKDCIDEKSLDINGVFTITGKLEDYQDILIRIKSIYDILDAAINDNNGLSDEKNIQLSKSLFGWYKDNEYFIKQIIKTYSSLPTNNQNLNQIIKNYNFYFHFSERNYWEGTVRGYKTINFKNNQLIAGHIGASIVSQKQPEIHQDIIFTPNVDWLLSEWVSNDSKF